MILLSNIFFVNTKSAYRVHKQNPRFDGDFAYLYL